MEIVIGLVRFGWANKRNNRGQTVERKKTAGRVDRKMLSGLYKPVPSPLAL